MQPEAGGMRRFCQHCRTHVHDLSAMDERQARAFLKATAGLDLCLAYARDDDDRIVFAGRPLALPDAPAPSTATSPVDDPSVVPIARLRRPPTASLAQLVCAASAAVLLGACTAHGDEPALEIGDPELEMQLEEIGPAVLIPAAPPEAEPPPPEPEQAEPCDPKPKSTRPHTKGRRVGVRLIDDDSPL